MRDIVTKVDSSSSLNAAEFNSYVNELENAVTRAGITLDAGAGPDNDLFMLARSILIHSLAGMSRQDNGAANTFVLAPTQALFEQPAAYVDGMTVRFKAAATNTGACTINDDGKGAVSFTKAGGAAFVSGEIVAGNIITAEYFSGTNRFEEVSNTTPDASGPAAPDQVAVYADSGSATQITLTIEPGYNQPSAFTDQMVILFKVNVTNDGVGNHPVNVSGLGIKDLVEKDGTNPIAGRLTAGDWVMAIFREVRDKFEIAFVYDNPLPDAVIPATVSSSSGTVFNLDSVPEVRAPTSYQNGMVIIFRAPQTNTGSVDVNLDGIGLVDLRTLTGSNFLSGEIKANDLIIGTYQVGGGEDRFRAFVGTEFIDLRKGRSARVSNPVQNAIATTFPGPDVVIQFGIADVDFDELNFFSDVDDGFVIPAGEDIERVDVSANLTCSITTSGETTGGYDLTIQKNGVGIAQASMPFKLQGLGSVYVSLDDEPVVAGDVFRLTLRVTGTGTNVVITDNSKFNITVSKFSS